ncbi:MAG: hypothetical protein LBQ47_02160 [Endomicrobium sp.]|jgi:hypothetical protein|nr:hypothetical protein [Endomicrobium sp.]
MALTQNKLVEEVFKSKLGRYDIVRLALDWIEVKKYDEDYRKLTQAELINKALGDVVENIATPEKIAELRKKVKKEEKNREPVQEGIK